MTAFNRGRERETRIFGTRGELYGDGQFIEIYDFLTDQTERIDTHLDSPILSGHGGGDWGVISRFIAALQRQDQSLILSGPEESLESHVMAFAAERARRQGCVVDVG
ncbi:MAG: hypothetical protein U0401_25555 [Anaerolineae bacterium]